jgi:hypothetical protein
MMRRRDSEGLDSGIGVVKYCEGDEIPCTIGGKEKFILVCRDDISLAGRPVNGGGIVTTGDNDGQEYERKIFIHDYSQ